MPSPPFCPPRCAPGLGRFVVDPKAMVALATHYLGGYLPQGAAPVRQAATHALDAWRHRGWLFVLPLLWTGSLVFGALDRALNVAFDSPPRRDFLRRVAARLAMLLVLGLLFVAIATPAP